MNKSNWVNIAKEGQPDECGRYLILYKYGNLKPAAFIGDYDCNEGWNCKLNDIQITHWAKIPELPEPDNNKPENKG